MQMVCNYRSAPTIRHRFAMLNTVFSILYISEMLAKWVAYGFWGYWRDPLNLFDGILVLLIIVELGLSGQSATGALRGLRGLRFLRTLRALRVVRLYRMLHVEKMDASTQASDHGRALVVDTENPSRDLLQ